MCCPVSEPNLKCKGGLFLLPNAFRAAWREKEGKSFGLERVTSSLFFQPIPPPHYVGFFEGRDIVPFVVCSALYLYFSEVFERLNFLLIKPTRQTGRKGKKRRRHQVWKEASKVCKGSS